MPVLDPSTPPRENLEPIRNRLIPMKDLNGDFTSASHGQTSSENQTCLSPQEAIKEPKPPGAPLREMNHARLNKQPLSGTAMKLELKF